MDEQLVLLLNERSMNLGIEACHIPPCVLEVHSTEKDMYKAISSKTQVSYTSNILLLIIMLKAQLKLRFAILRIFNNLVASVLPLIDLTNVETSNGLANKLCNIRGLIFFDTKNSFLREVINKTAVSAESPLIFIDRLSAAKDEQGLCNSTSVADKNFHKTITITLYLSNV